MSKKLTVLTVVLMSVVLIGCIEPNQPPEVHAIVMAAANRPQPTPTLAPPVVHIWFDGTFIASFKINMDASPPGLYRQSEEINLIPEMSTFICGGVYYFGPNGSLGCSDGKPYGEWGMIVETAGKWSVIVTHPNVLAG